MRKLSVGLLFCVLLLAKGTAEAEECSTSDSESVLQSGYDYTYQFESVAFAEAVGTTNDKSKLSIKCDVSISHTSNCLYTLQLENCFVNGVGGPPASESAWIESQPVPELSKYAILFSLVNGEVNEIFTHEDDPIYFINIKRGALSAFVFKLSYTNHAAKVSHTDIHGTCPLEATPLDGTGETVKTSKDMLNCAFPSRTDWQFSPWSLFWNMSFIQHLINSTTECVYKIDIDDRHINKVMCKERHAIMLESSSRTAVAVQTNIFYTMSYVKSSPQKEKPVYSSLKRKTGIQYEYERTADPKASPENFMIVANQMLSDLVKDSVDEIRLFTIPQFTNFVAWIRSSSDLIPLVETVKSCSYLPETGCSPEEKALGMSYLSDALVQCNNLPCIEAVAHMAKNGDFSQSYLDFIFYSWSNMHVSKPSILRYIKDICEVTDSSLCWMSIASLVKRTYSKYQHFGEEELQQMQEVAQHFRNGIDRVCVPRNSKLEIPQLLTYMKAIGNMGSVYNLLVSDGHEQLIECFLRSDLPEDARVFVFEALKTVNPCQDEIYCSEIYKQLLPILTNESTATTLRALVFNYLVHSSLKPGLEEEILRIFKEENNLQIKSYMASYLNSLFVDPKFKSKHKNFCKAMLKLLENNNISLDKIAHQPGTMSSSYSHIISVNPEFLPSDLNTLSTRTTTTALYEQFDVVPRFLHHDFLMQYLNNLVPLIRAGGFFEGLEGLAIVFQKVVKDVNPARISLEKIYTGLLEILKEFEHENTTISSQFNWDEKIIQNVRKLEEQYRKHRKNPRPYFTTYLDLFGSTISYLSSENTDFSAIVPGMQGFLKKIGEGIVYNTTRVIRVIEAYHQVPTMMGLPLNWTTNATLAFSVRNNMKIQFIPHTYEMQAEGMLQPSFALTFVNRMVLDLPTITQIGIQANSSGYSATQWKAKLEYSKEKKLFSIKKPTKSQKLLELFRTNQIIRHDSYPNIPDWDIDRQSSSWCMNNHLSSLFGLQLCVDKSYPQVTKRVKPWALMAGWVKWQLYLNPFDEKLESYDLEIIKPSEIQTKGTIIKLSTPGSDNRREVFFTADKNDARGETKYELKITELQDFVFYYRRNKLIDNNKENGMRSIVYLKLYENSEHEIIHNEQVRHEERDENHADKNRSQKSQKTIVKIQEQFLSLNTPYNRYKFQEENYMHGENTNANVLLSYENLNPGKKWLHLILPSSFWENDSKAWMRIQINWKSEDILPSSIARQTVCTLNLPQSSVQLSASSLEMSGREQMIFNLTKSEVNSGKMLAFANLTYDYWSSLTDDSNEKEVKLWNLTMSQKSFAVETRKVKQGSQLKYEIAFKRAAMWPKDGKNINYVGWWNSEAIQYFQVQEYEIKLTLDTDTQVISNQRLVDKYSTLTNKDLEGLSNQLITTNATLYYPFRDRKEHMNFGGYFILSRGSTTFRFQKNFVMESSYHKLHLTSHSVYRADNEVTYLDHNSFFTHMPSQAKAYNNFEYRRTYPAGKCMEIGWKHNIKSNVFDLSSNATYKCNANGPDLYTMLLDMKTNSSDWNMLNTRVSQIIEQVSPEYTYETCNFTHPLFLINVTAEWSGKLKDHKKNVILSCAGGTCPNTEILIKVMHNGKTNVHLNLPDESQLTYDRKLSHDAKNLKIKINYLHDKSEESQGIQLNGQLLNEHYHIWKTDINIDTYSKIKSLICETYGKIAAEVAAIAKNSQHPLNKMLEPSLKLTLYNYWQSIQKETKDLKMMMWTSFKETIGSLKPFYKNAVTVFVNIVSNMHQVSKKFYDSYKEKSVIIWAFNYFNLPSYFYQTTSKFQESLLQFLQMFRADDRNLHFEFQTGRILEWESFKEWPSISSDGITIDPFSWHDNRIGSHFQPAKLSKVAMVFGPLHVYTFDGHLYDTAEYSSECMFLLAHDLRKSSFTIFSTKQAIHILFLEMTISINDEDEVFINGSHVPSKLPIESQNGKVAVRRSNTLEVWSPTLKVTCSGKDFLCILELDIWHSGEIFGLLGNADGLIDNEFMLPDGKLANNILDFVSSFEVSGRLECKNLRLQYKSLASSEGEKHCSSLFSELCLQSKNIHESFMNVCATDFAENRNACYGSSAYSALCFHKNLPSSSIDCNGKKQESNKIGHKLEVIFIAQEHSSFTSVEKKTIPFKGIERILTAIEEKFKANGYSSVFFSLIGFGGKDVHYQPTIHTVGRRVWLPLQILVNDVLQTLVFDGEEEVDALHVLKYGHEVLGHDTFNSKIVIILTTHDKQSKNKNAITSIQQELEKNGITLYTFSSYPSLEKGKKVFGVRADGLVFPSPKEDGTVFLDYPKGDLAKLTAATRGSIFLSKFVLANSPSSFFTEFADEVWSKVHKEAKSCRKCSPVKSGRWWKVNECNVINC